MKIAFVLDDSLDRPDGVQQAVVTTGEWMRAKGHDIHYIVGRTERSDIENVHSLARSLKVKFNGNTMSTPLPVSSLKLKKFLAREAFDVLHVQMPYSPFFAAKIVKSAPRSTKIIGTFHILPYSRLNTMATKQLGRFLKKSLKRFDHFISTSEPAAAFAKATFGIDSIALPNPVATRQFSESKKLRNETRRQIVFLGRLVERKGVIELMKAYKRLIENDEKLIARTSLVIGGKGPLKNKIHTMSKSFPAGASVLQLGFVPEQEKAALLSSADVAVFPSTSGESFGIVLVEAMASGSRIIIAGDNPGYASVLGEQPDLLVNPRDTGSFAKKLAWALQDNAETKRLSKWLQGHYMQYDVATVCKTLLKLYNA